MEHSVRLCETLLFMYEMLRSLNNGRMFEACFAKRNRLEQKIIRIIALIKAWWRIKCARSLRSSQYGMQTRAHARTRKTNQVKKKINKWENGEKLTHTKLHIHEEKFLCAGKLHLHRFYSRERDSLSQWVSERVCVFSLYSNHMYAVSVFQFHHNSAFASSLLCNCWCCCYPI